VAKNEISRIIAIAGVN